MMEQEGDGDGNSSVKSAVNSHAHWNEIANDQVSQEVLKDLVRKAKENCENNQMWGNTPGDLIDKISDLIKFKKPLVPWSRVLKLFTASCSETEIDYTMRKRSKRFGTRPGIKKFEKLKLAVGIDTSGSISNEQLNLFMNELKWVEKEGGYIHIYECDTKINRDYPYKDFDGSVTGRGGTDLEPVLKRVSEEKYDALIFFTDFYTSKIETNYHIPTLWVLSQNDMEREDFPYLFPGNIYIRIKDDMDGCERV
jgi:predicted metal-dependent peptidase